MRLLFLTALTMVAFAVNSLLNRAGLADNAIGPAGFALVRVASGALVLFLLVRLTRSKQALKEPMDWRAPFALAAYLLGFSFAYVQLDAGFGALVLFAVVQATMFAGAVRARERPPMQRWGGMALSLAGLAYLMWPTEAFTAPAAPLLLMVIAALGWGVYSLIGRGAKDPLVATSRNFLLATPIVLLVALSFLAGESFTAQGVMLAVVSGAVTSGLGYALWYHVLPKLPASTGALVQLSVPVIAMVLGAVLLGEVLSLRMVIASVIVLGGIAVGLVARN